MRDKKKKENTSLNYRNMNKMLTQPKILDGFHCPHCCPVHIPTVS